MEYEIEMYITVLYLICIQCIKKGKVHMLDQLGNGNNDKLKV